MITDSLSDLRGPFDLSAAEIESDSALFEVAYLLPYMQMSKNQRDLLKPLQASPTDVWASEFPLYAQTLKNGRCLLHCSYPDPS